MPSEVTDPKLLEQLNSGPQEVTDPEILGQLENKEKPIAPKKDAPVPDWGRENPNLYGVYGASKALAQTGLEMAGAAGGTAAGALGGPVGAAVGGGVGYAGAKRVGQAIGLSDEPVDMSVGGISKDVAIGSASAAIPYAGRAAKWVGENVPGLKTATALLSDVPVRPGMLELANRTAKAKSMSPSRGFIESVTGKIPSAAELEKELNKTIDVGISKAIRPGVETQRNFSQVEKYKNNAREAIKQIVGNKENLQLIDENGDVVSKLPETLTEMSQALDQTKGQIYKKYNDMQLAAGKQGVKIKLTPIARELEKVADSKVLNTMSPNTAKYAEAVATRLKLAKSFTTDEAQEAISIANRSLDAFYKNPSPETASNAYIDSMIANRMRRSLDDVIENSVGQGYQMFKNQYGSLKAIEKDLNRRMVVDARKNVKGLIDFTDVFSGSQVVDGLLTMSPTRVAAGSAAKAIAAITKYRNDPNTHVKNMFSAVDSMMSKPTTLAGRTQPLDVAGSALGVGMMGESRTENGVVRNASKYGSLKFPDMIQSAEAGTLQDYARARGEDRQRQIAEQTGEGTVSVDIPDSAMPVSDSGRAPVRSYQEDSARADRLIRQMQQQKQMQSQPTVQRPKVKVVARPVPSKSGDGEELRYFEVGPGGKETGRSFANDPNM